jgi:hypothetical protein
MSGLPRLGWVCYRFVYAGTIKPNAVMLAHGLHSVRYLALLTWLIMFTARFDALPNSFRVACFSARRSTLVTECYQLPCEWLRSMSYLVRLPLQGGLYIPQLAALLRYLIL